MTTSKRKQPLGQTIGGVLFGFEQQVLRNVPPPHELVHQARPDDPVPAGDGGFMTLVLPDDELPQATPEPGEGTAPGPRPGPAREPGQGSGSVPDPRP